MTSWTQLQALDCKYLDVPLERDPAVAGQYMELQKDPTFKPRLLGHINDYLDEFGHWLRDNDYPYLFCCEEEEEIVHKVFWFRGELDMESVKLMVAEELAVDSTDVVVCCNNPTLKTVPEINHYQVFVRFWEK